MDITRHVELVTTTYADELSIRSLAEISAITADQNVRIIGGQMASLLLTAFPVPGLAVRRTRDADAAITTELAGSGLIHQRLLDHGYTATSGNSYTRPFPDLATAGGPFRNSPWTCSYRPSMDTSDPRNTADERSTQPPGLDSP